MIKDRAVDISFGGLLKHGQLGYLPIAQVHTSVKHITRAPTVSIKELDSFPLINSVTPFRNSCNAFV